MVYIIILSVSTKNKFEDTIDHRSDIHNLRVVKLKPKKLFEKIFQAVISQLLKLCE